MLFLVDGQTSGTDLQAALLFCFYIVGAILLCATGICGKCVKGIEILQDSCYSSVSYESQRQEEKRQRRLDDENRRELAGFYQQERRRVALQT